MELEKKNALTRILDAMEGMEKCLSCAICLEISSDPAETRCGHLFCRTCIQKVWSHPGASCPVCKSNLTRRSISFSEEIGLARQQLAKLIEAIRSDSGIDVTSCLNMHYETRRFYSVCSSSPQSPRSANVLKIAIHKSKNESSNKTTPENSINDLNSRQNSSRNPTTTKFEPQDIPTTRVSPLRMPSENDVPLEKSPKSAVENPEMPEFDFLEELVDKPVSEGRQSLLDTSKTNQKTSKSSRIAQFGKELRRESVSRLHKKAEIGADVRNKSPLSNSSDQSMERVRQGSLGHDMYTDLSLIEPNNIVDRDKRIKSGIEKTDLVTSAIDDNLIWPNDIQVPSENVASETAKDPSKTNIDASRSDDRGKNRSDPLKAPEKPPAELDSSIKLNKRSSKDQEKLSDAFKVDLGCFATTENIRVVPKKTNRARNVGTPRTKRTQYTNLQENVVRFKKLGHLFKMHRKVVTFLYLGKTKPPVLPDELVGLCRLCSNRILAPASKCKQNASSTLSRAKSFEATIFQRNRIEDLSKDSNLLPLHEPSTFRIADLGTNTESNRQFCPSENASTSRNQTIAAIISPGNQNLPIDQREPPKSLGISKKRKRSESPERDRMFSRLKGAETLRNPENEESCAGVGNTLQDCRANTKTPSDDLEAQTTRTKRSKSHEIDTNDIAEPSERQNLVVDIDFQGSTASKVRKSKDNLEPDSATVPTLAKTSCAKTSELVGTERHSVIENLEFNQISDLPESTKACDGVLSPEKGNCSKIRNVGGETDRFFESDKNARNSEVELNTIEENNEGGDAHEFDSLMNITGEQELLKNFEEDLFAPVITEQEGPDDRAMGNKGQDGGTTEKEEQNGGTSQTRRNNNVGDYESLNQSESVLTTKSGRVKEPKENSMFKLTDGIVRIFKDPSELSRIKDAADIRPNVKIHKRNKENVTEEKKSTTRISRELKGAKRQMQAPKNPKRLPLYQSTPNPSENRAPRNPLSANRSKKQEASFSISSVDSDVSRHSKLNPPRGNRGCIICSGLTSKQSEDVKYLSTLFNMEYTKTFSDGVTHVIVATNGDNNGACKTLKYLQGVVYRKWILNFNWIVDCVAQHKLLNEGIYEVVDSPTLIPGPRMARVGEKAPFENFVFLCIEPIQNISTRDYEDLLRHMGATVVHSLADLAAHKSILKIITLQADFHDNKIIEWHQITKAVPIAQEWVIECISQYSLISPVPFLQELVPQDVLDLGFPEAFIQDDNNDFMYDTLA